MPPPGAYTVPLNNRVEDDAECARRCSERLLLTFTPCVGWELAVIVVYFSIHEIF